MLEREPLEKCASDGQLCVYEHEGFWQCMDTFRDWTLLDSLWKSGNAPWKIWNDSNDYSVKAFDSQASVRQRNKPDMIVMMRSVLEWPKDEKKNRKRK